jgi:osmotically inducible lipoprotein OsmB
MRKTLMAIAAAAVVALCTVSPASAGPSNSTLSGAAIGAGTGALVAGPVGAVAGGVVGAVVGGPTGKPHRRCWHDPNGVRHCKSYRW